MQVVYLGLEAQPSMLYKHNSWFDSYLGFALAYLDDNNICLQQIQKEQNLCGETPLITK